LSYPDAKFLKVCFSSSVSSTYPSALSYDFQLTNEQVSDSAFKPQKKARQSQRLTGFGEWVKRFPPIRFYGILVMPLRGAASLPTLKPRRNKND
jgi:hypothetical protein